MNSILQRNRARLVVESASIGTQELVGNAGVRPELSWSIGDPIAGQTRHRKRNGWQLTSTVDNRRPLDEHVEELLAGVNRHHLQRLSKLDCKVRMYCFVYHHDRPCLALSAAVIQQVAAIGASLDFDAFALPSQESLDCMDL